MNAKERAKRSAAAMWADDKASQWSGLELIDVDAGKAEMALSVQPHHCNGHQICHGGIIFLLADSAFAFACNSRNQRSVSQHNMISYIAAASAGDRLCAEASETSLTGRNGITDVRVTNQRGDLIAEFRGMSRAIKGQLFEENP